MRRIQTYSNKYNTEKYSYCFKRENKFNLTKKMKKKSMKQHIHTSKSLGIRLYWQVENGLVTAHLGRSH